MKRKILMVLFAVALQAAPVQAQQEVVTIDHSPALVGRTNAAQRFADYLNLAQGQDKLPLTLTFYNGTDTAPGFAWLRVSIGGRPAYTEKDFKGGRVFADNVSGDIGPGATQIVIDAGGRIGSTVQWVLTTPKPVLTKAQPDKVPTGQAFTLQGKNFCRVANVNVVTIDKKPAQVVSATDTDLQVKVPNDAKGGKAEVLVAVAGMKTEPLTITIQPKPEVTSVNMFSAPPGQPLVISGKNFSPKAAENKVQIGDYPAEVTQASPTSLTVTIPLALDPIQPVWGLPVVVETNTIKSNDNVTVNVQMRVIENDSQSPVAAPAGPFY